MTRITKNISMSVGDIPAPTFSWINPQPQAGRGTQHIGQLPNARSVVLKVELYKAVQPFIEARFYFDGNQIGMGTVSAHGDATIAQLHTVINTNPGLHTVAVRGVDYQKNVHWDAITVNVLGSPSPSQPRLPSDTGGAPEPQDEGGGGQQPTDSTGPTPPSNPQNLLLVEPAPTLHPYNHTIPRQPPIGSQEMITLTQGARSPATSFDLHKIVNIPINVTWKILISDSHGNPVEPREWNAVTTFNRGRKEDTKKGKRAFEFHTSYVNNWPATIKKLTDFTIQFSVPPNAQPGLYAIWMEVFSLDDNKNPHQLLDRNYIPLQVKPLDFDIQAPNQPILRRGPWTTIPVDIQTSSDQEIRFAIFMILTDNKNRPVAVDLGDYQGVSGLMSRASRIFSGSKIYLTINSKDIVSGSRKKVQFKNHSREAFVVGVKNRAQIDIRMRSSKKIPSGVYKMRIIVLRVNDDYEAFEELQEQAVVSILKDDTEQLIDKIESEEGEIEALCRKLVEELSAIAGPLHTLHKELSELHEQEKETIVSKKAFKIREFLLKLSSMLGKLEPKIQKIVHDSRIDQILQHEIPEVMQDIEEQIRSIERIQDDTEFLRQMNQYVQRDFPGKFKHDTQLTTQNQAQREELQRIASDIIMAVKMRRRAVLQLEQNLTRNRQNIEKYLAELVQRLETTQELCAHQDVDAQNINAAIESLLRRIDHIYKYLHGLAVPISQYGASYKEANYMDRIKELKERIERAGEQHG